MVQTLLQKTTSDPSTNHLLKTRQGILQWRMVQGLMAANKKLVANLANGSLDPVQVLKGMIAAWLRVENAYYKLLGNIDTFILFLT